MDAIRRGAMMKMGRLLAGGAGAVAALGRGQVLAQANMDAARTYPPQPDGYPSAFTGEAAVKRINPLSPLDRARHKVAEPLFDKMQELDGYRRFAPANYQHAADTNSYLSTLRSTSRHWKCCVAADRDKKQASMMESLEAEIQKILRGPIDSLEETFQQAIASFVEEFNKP